MKTILFVACCLIGLNTWNQSEEIVIQGHVFDRTYGDPLVGVSIKTMRGDIATVTDFNGSYLMKLEKRAYTLIFSLPGYLSQEIKVATDRTLDVKLQLTGPENEITLDERENSAKSKVREAKYSRDAEMAPTGISFSSRQTNQEPAWNTEDYDFIRENGFMSTSDQSISTFSADVDRASYSNMRRFLKQGNRPPVDAIRIEEMINYFHYQYPLPDTGDPLAIYSELGTCPWNPKHHLLHVGVQSERIETEHLPASNLVFLIDVSGSMNQANKLPLLISSFRLLVDQLREQDAVSIVTYAGRSEVILNGVGGREKDRIIEALDALLAGGSTAGAQGVLTAYHLASENFIKGGNNRVILATDGDFNIGISSDSELTRMIEQKRSSGVYLSVLGFGMGNYKDNKMQKLADSGNGNHQYIDDIQEAKKVFIHEFGGSLFTVAKDVKIQIEFNPKKVAGYRLIGYENRKLENQDFNNDEKDAGEIGSGHTVTVLYEIIPAGIQSKWLSSVEKRYTSKDETSSYAKDELAFVKLRYKNPDGTDSKLIQLPVGQMVKSDSDLSQDFYWTAAVAGFGMILRDSEFKQASTIDQVLGLAKKGKGKDLEGYRAEFIELVEKSTRIYGLDHLEDEPRVDQK
ncbi:MAG: von Willebrand factor type A domain-containing protein [Saprospiraceae bacterium]|nr:von Willebrand factor type A domain-containing protein [Saprospiraceae bacterium]